MYRSIVQKDLPLCRPGDFKPEVTTILLLSVQSMLHAGMQIRTWACLASKIGLQPIAMQEILNDAHSQVLSSMTSLETLDLENNHLGLTALPEGGMPSELLSLSRLQCLNLTQNKLSKIPDVVVKFGSLRILDLTNNWYANAGHASAAEYRRFA